VSSMYEAGPPAHPGTHTPRTPTTPGPVLPASGATPTGGITAEGTGGPRASVDSPFARLTATATYRVPGSDDPLRRSKDGDWHDPDRDAGLGLGAGNTPYDRTLQRWRPGASRDRARSRFRMALRFLHGSADADASDDALRSYPWHQVTVEDARDFHAAVSKHYTTQAARNDMVCMLRAVVRECYQVHLISALRRELLLEELYTLAPGRSRRRHRITDHEFDRLMDACLDTGTAFARARNSAIVALFRTTGLRVSELVHLRLANWDQRESSLLLTRTKNNDPHVVFLHPATRELLEAWLEVRGTLPGRLFHGEHRSVEAGLTPHSIRHMLATRCSAADIETFGTHDFRRTFATEMLRRYDAALVSKLLNHRKLASTLIYDMASDDEMREAIGSIDLTFRQIGGAA
jgi:integrase/recombinase XerD